MCGKRRFGPSQMEVMRLTSNFNVNVVAIKANEAENVTIREMKNYISSIGNVRISQREAPKGAISSIISKNRPVLTRNTTLREFFPNQVPSWFETDYYTTTFLTGHGPFNEYLHRFKKLNTDLCPCRMQASQTVKHILTECPLYESQVVNCYEQKSQTLSEFVKDAPSLSMFRTLTKNLYSTLLRQQEPPALNDSSNVD